MTRTIKCKVWSGTMFLDGGDANIHVFNKDSTNIEIEASVPHKKYVICLFTGLLDKNGKEIYESDILDVTGKNDDYEISATVVWDVVEACWGYEKQDGDDFEVGELWAIVDKRTEIIGNIYENPELLK